MKKILKSLLNSTIGRAIIKEIIESYLKKIVEKRPHLHIVIDECIKALDEEIKLLKL